MSVPIKLPSITLFERIVQVDVAVIPVGIVSRDQVARAGRGAADRDQADLSEKMPPSGFGTRARRSHRRR